MGGPARLGGTSPGDKWMSGDVVVSAHSNDGARGSECLLGIVVGFACLHCGMQCSERLSDFVVIPARLDGGSPGSECLLGIMVGPA